MKKSVLDDHLKVSNYRFAKKIDEEKFLKQKDHYLNLMVENFKKNIQELYEIWSEDNDSSIVDNLREYIEEMIFEKNKSFFKESYEYINTIKDIENVALMLDKIILDIKVNIHQKLSFLTELYSIPLKLNKEINEILRYKRKGTA